MNPSLRLSLILGLLLLGLNLGFTADAGPIDWLKAAGHSITHPQRRQTRQSRKAVSRPTESSARTAAVDSPLRSEFSAPAASPQPATSAVTPPSHAARPEARPRELPSPSARPEESPSPSVPPPASLNPPTRSDIPYGVPVPDKPGFVMSPYAPKGGYVDVRNLPSGIQVKDPYTGKVFLTP